MTAVDDAVPSPPPVPDDVKFEPGVSGVCPYLAAADGAWRSVSVAREHRCGAVAPPAALAAEKQRLLCLTSDHMGCATYEAARASRPIAHDRAPTLPRPLARSTPVVLDHGRLAITMPSLRADHLSGQAVLVALMCVAFAAIILARLTGGGVPAGAGDASPIPQATAQSSSSAPTPAPPTATPLSSVPATQSAAPGGSVAPASPGPSTSATRTYKVKAGDTLIGIAAKFSTTVSAIKQLNGITNVSSLRIGQVLQIP
jgi:LysM repeat protein